MITYNQEAYIAQAIESVLMQQTNFPVELVIGEDCSTDGTRSIVREFRERYPRQIHLLLPEHNLGAINNFLATMNNCHGKYIALCEGDDYWTDPLKLQKQVNFLDNNPDFVICFHNVMAFYQDNSKESYLFSKPNQKKVSDIRDLLISNFIQTVSVLFKNGLIIEFPEWYNKISIGDWPLHIINARYGKIGYLDDVMAHYRIHNEGMWNTMDRFSLYNSIIEMFHYLDSYLDYNYSPIIKSTISGYYLDIAALFADRSDYMSAKSYFINSFHEFLNNFWRSRYIFILLYYLYLPKFYRLTKVIVSNKK